MELGFFEEFPTERNVSKLNLIPWDIDLVIAAKSINEFYYLKNRLKNKKNLKNIIYWPILSKKHGYWLSPFVEKKILKEKILEILNQKDLMILWDAELPIYKELMVLNIFSFFRNKRLIKQFFKKAKQNNIKIITAEYPFENFFFRNILSFLGLKFKKYYRKNILAYFGFAKTRFTKNFLKKQVKIAYQKDKNVIIGLGPIASGILGNEPMVSPKTLDHNLQFIQKVGVKKVYIFRLGGLNQEYAGVIRKYIEPFPIVLNNKMP